MEETIYQPGDIVGAVDGPLAFNMKIDLVGRDKEGNFNLCKWWDTDNCRHSAWFRDHEIEKIGG